MLRLHLRCKGPRTLGRVTVGLGEFTALQQGPYAGQEQRPTRHAAAQRAAAPRTELGLLRSTLLPPLPVCVLWTLRSGVISPHPAWRDRRSLHATRVRVVQARAEVFTARRSPGHHSPVCGPVAAMKERWKGYLMRGDGLGRQRRCHS